MRADRLPDQGLVVGDQDLDAHRTTGSWTSKDAPASVLRGAVVGDDSAAVLEQDVLTDGQAQAVAAGLGREERLEQLAEVRVRDSRSMVG